MVTQPFEGSLGPLSHTSSNWALILIDCEVSKWVFNILQNSFVVYFSYLANNFFTEPKQFSVIYILIPKLIELSFNYF